MACWNGKGNNGKGNGDGKIADDTVAWFFSAWIGGGEKADVAPSTGLNLIVKRGDG